MVLRRYTTGMTQSSQGAGGFLKKSTTSSMTLSYQASSLQLSSFSLYHCVVFYFQYSWHTFIYKRTKMMTII